MRDQKSRPMVATATVTNTGKRRGTEIVQCFQSTKFFPDETAKKPSPLDLRAAPLLP
jgi:hypothetical protein